MMRSQKGQACRWCNHDISLLSKTTIWDARPPLALVDKHSLLRCFNCLARMGIGRETLRFKHGTFI